MRPLSSYERAVIWDYIHSEWRTLEGAINEQNVEALAEVVKNLQEVTKKLQGRVE